MESKPVIGSFEKVKDERACGVGMLITGAVENTVASLEAGAAFVVFEVTVVSCDFINLAKGDSDPRPFCDNSITTSGF